MITKEQLIDKVNKNDTGWLYEIYGQSYRNKDEYKVVYDQNYGDGNDYFICIHFINHNLYLQLEGTYSSWDSPYWDKISFAQPYEHVETRYKRINYEDIRDQKIKEVLDNDQNNEKN